MNTKTQMENLVYKFRESLADDFINCKVTGKDWSNDKHEQFVLNLLTIRRLARKHHRLAEMDCNGEGVIRGVHYYGGTIDDYARRQYGYGVKSAYVKDDVSVFNVESDKVSDKIKALIEKLPYDAMKGQLYPWKVEFQGDPRGNTVKLFYIDRYIDINF